MNKTLNERIIDALHDLLEYIGSGLYNADDPPIYKDTADLALYFLQKSMWIPCSERLPGVNRKVLVCTNIGNEYVARRYGENYIVICECSVKTLSCSRVIAWMPLPEPYEEKEE